MNVLLVSLKRIVILMERDRSRDKYSKITEVKKKLLKEYQNEICKTPGEVHYLPHRPVIHEERDTTKIRAVFDASYSTNGPSVNECLYSGPYFLTKIFDILIKFRFNSIAILTDIKQFFLNVAISKEHMNYLCFFWYDDVTSENEAKLIIHRFLWVVFSPFLLNGTIRYLKKYVVSNQKFIIDLLKIYLYVNDTTSGCSSIEKGIKYYQKK